LDNRADISNTVSKTAIVKDAKFVTYNQNWKITGTKPEVFKTEVIKTDLSVYATPMKLKKGINVRSGSVKDIENV